MRLEKDSSFDGVRQREVLLEGEHGPIPAVVWTPEEQSEPTPLVLVGHGASGTKYEAHVSSLAHDLVVHEAISAAAIDGPVHGDRRRDGAGGQRAFLDFATAWSSDTSLTDRMVSDWTVALDAVMELAEVGGPVGYWGLSMGTILGLPFVAAERRVEVAVLGLMGLTGPTAARIGADAAKLSCPVLLLLQWSDAIFPRQAGFDLFEAIGSTDKTLHVNPGGHGDLPRAEFVSSRLFLAERLLGESHAN